MKMRYVLLLAMLCSSPLHSAVASENPFASRSDAFEEFKRGKVMLLTDAQLGCCVFVTDKGAKCTQTNKTFCESRAKQDNIKSRFYPNVNCASIPECK